MILTECVYQVVVDDVTTLIVNAIMTTIAFVSALCAFLAYNHQRNRSKKDAACKLEENYANVILDENDFILSIYTRSGVINHIKDIFNINAIKDFDRTELDKLLKRKFVAHDEFERIISDIDPAVILQCRLAHVKTVQERDAIQQFFSVTSDPNGGEHITNEHHLRKDLRNNIDNLLNQLECFCMNCRYGLADEEILYQSLHQTFLSLVWMLYPTISMKNINNEDKMYTNTIWLFLTWRKRLAKIKWNAKEERNRLENKAKIATEKAKAKQEKAKSAKAKIHSGKTLR